ncbi:MAG TPA: outer membrane beta-barrel protein [Terriglobales bacterium]|jgi:hypothetical protein|nr:outer membrane beta-barrel protein [Terriglobales bacterium]
MLHRIKRGIALLSVAACLLLASATVFAQDQPAPKWEIFAGYSWADPNAKISGVPLRNYPVGVGLAGTYDFNKWLGLTLDYGGHFNNGTSGTRIPSTLNTVMAGPKLTFRGEHFSPFLEALVGYSRLAPDHFTADNRFGFQGGVGIDMNLTKHWALRLIQADFITAHHRFGAGGLPGSGVPKTILRGTRLQGGVVWLIGGEEEKPVSASCSLEPTSLLAGEAVKATATPTNFPPNHKLTYTWNSTGGKVTPNEANAAIDTTGLAPGSYTVSAHVTDNKRVADCSAPFTVNAPPAHSPTMSCTANPTSVITGDPSTITCDCKSTDGNTASVSNWSASAGKVTGSGATATLDTVGAPAGPITVRATCTDDKNGLTAPGSANVDVTPPAEKPHATKACEIDFAITIKKGKPARVDNAAKGCLDGAADALLQSPNAKSVLVGEQEEKEKPKTLAAQRAVNTKDYLTSGENQKAIDASRIDPRTGTDSEAKVEVWIVPEGANFDQDRPGTTPINEAKVKPQSRKPAAPAKRAPRKKKAA